MATLVKCDSCNELSDLAPLNWWVLDIFGRKVDVTTDGISRHLIIFARLTVSAISLVLGPK